MKPIFISAQCFQGETFQYQLASINIFGGANDAGKSRIVNAIQYGLLDYLPKLGKQPVSLRKLMTPGEPQMTVTLSFDDGTTVRRGLKTKPDGDVGRIKDPNAPSWEIPSGMFSLREYLAKTEKQKIEEIFRSIGQNDLPFNEVEFIGKLLTIEALPISECAKAIAELKTLLNESVARRKNSRQTIQDWLTTLVGELDAAGKRYAILREQSSAQLVGLRPGPALPRSGAAAIAAKRKEIEDVQAKLNGLLTQQRTIAATSRRRIELRGIIEQPQLDLTEKASFLKELAGEIALYASMTQLVEQKIAAKRTERAEAEALAIKIESRQEAIEKRLEDLTDQSHCPYCKSTRKDWKVEYSKELNAELEKLKTAHSATAAVEKTGIKELQGLLAALEESRRSDVTVEAKKTRLKALQSEIDSAEKRKAAVDKARSELTGIQESTGTVDPMDIEQCNGKITTLRADLAALEATEQVYTNYQANQKRFADIEKELISQGTKVEVFKKASKMVVQEQSTIVQDVFRPIIEMARKFTDGILPGTLDYRDGELGMDTDKGWVSHEVMATMSQTLTYIGVAIALSAKSPVKVVLIDEGGIISQDRKPKIINRLFELIATGVIDSAVIADPTPAGYEEFDKFKDFQLVFLA